jgi:hypothetical protein
VAQRLRSLTVAILTLTWALPLCAGGRQDRAGPNIQKLIAETQRTASNANRVAFVWWIPVDFWRMSMDANANVTKEQADQFIAILASYTLVALADGDIGPVGGVTWKGEEALRSALMVIDGNGREYQPIPSAQVSPDAANVSAILKPVLANMVGSLGQNVHFFYFPATGEGGTPIVNPRSDGTFAVKVAGEVYRWHLPLGALLPEKVCPADGERMNGAWKFCPRHGKELTSG